MDRQDSPYRRGNYYDIMPIPMQLEHCVWIDAGAVQLVVESRQLTNAILDSTYAGVDMPHAAVEFDDYGPTLHVCGSDDRLEHLRFDCFKNEPHYHYVDQTRQGNTILRIDEVALGDPIDFTMRCVEARLQEMLELAGAGPLAAKVDMRVVHAALPKVRQLLEQTRATVNA
jgi:hypothetical protein